MVITLENGNTITDAQQHLKMYYESGEASLKLLSGSMYKFEFSNGTTAVIFTNNGNKLTFQGLGDSGNLIGARFYWA